MISVITQLFKNWILFNDVAQIPVEPTRTRFSLFFNVSCYPDQKKKQHNYENTYAQIKTYKKYKNSTLKSHFDKYHFNNKTFNNAQ